MDTNESIAKVSETLESIAISSVRKREMMSKVVDNQYAFSLPRFLNLFYREP
jgi:hypothetical protein